MGRYIEEGKSKLSGLFFASSALAFISAIVVRLQRHEKATPSRDDPQLPRSHLDANAPIWEYRICHPQVRRGCASHDTLRRSRCHRNLLSEPLRNRRRARDPARPARQTRAIAPHLDPMERAIALPRPLPLLEEPEPRVVVEQLYD